MDEEGGFFRSLEHKFVGFVKPSQVLFLGNYICEAFGGI